MKTTRMTKIATLAAAVLLPLGALADDADAAKAADKPAAQASSHCDMMDKMKPMADEMKRMMSEKGSCDAPQQQAAKRRGEPDRSKHFHPRDGK